MPRAPDLAGRVLDGRYELHALIGEGTFGRVYRGRDRRLQRAVAVKVIKPWWSEDPAWAARFEREAQLLARVNDPGIVQIFDVGQADDALYYVAELIDGESLAARMRRGPVAVAEAARIACELAKALGHAHDQQVVHRDIKPANILLDARGRVKVSDFGVARLVEGSPHGAGTTAIGTPRYMSPEQARGKPTVAASDVYGVGVVLYELLAGRPPFAGEAAVDVAVQHLQDVPPPLPQSVPPELRRVVTRALEKDPGARYVDGTALAAALRRAAPVAGAAAGASGPASLAAMTTVTPQHTGDPATRVMPRPPADGDAREGAVNPARRTRRLRGALVLGTAAAVLVVISLLVHASRTTVPTLVGLTRSHVAARAQRQHLQLRFARRYSSRPADTAIAQRPAPGMRVAKDSIVSVTLSDGPPPPRWRALTSLSGIGDGKSVPFKIRGARWRVIYTMSYEGRCTLLLVCFGPNAQARRLPAEDRVDSWDLDEGSDRVRTIASGPGVYQLEVSGGDDRARWSARIEDLS